MNAQVETHETIVRIQPTGSHHTLLVAPDGNFLAMEQDRLTTSATADDRVMWLAEAGSYRHATTGHRVEASAIPGTDGVRLHTRDGVLDARGNTATSSGATFTPSHGPEQLPSESLAFFRANGWVCLTSILAADTVEALQRLAGTDGHERAADETSRLRAALSMDSAVARTAAEPVSLWLIRAYMQTGDIRLGHAPALIVLHPDDGKRNVQGWHSDFPYHWGINAPGVVPTPTGDTVLGVQRNVCVSEFTRERGATAFKLGSHVKDHGPPDEWVTAATLQGKPGHRAEHGLPYNGPDADVIEAPAGSIILYDARTWHRAGVNRTLHSRAAMLQAMTPMYIMPKSDTSAAYKHFLTSPAHAGLTARERNEMHNLMLHTFNGPAQQAIAPDQELTELARAASSSAGSY